MESNSLQESTAISLESSLEMQREGVSIPFVRDYPITSVADFDAVGELFEHLEVVPTPTRYVRSLSAII